MKELSLIFAALSIGALAFFVHKVLWLVRYKQLQRMLMQEADGEMRQSEEQVLPAWDAHCQACWKAIDPEGPDDAAGVASSFDERIEKTLTWLERSTRSITSRLKQSLHGPIDPPTFTVLEAPGRQGQVVRADVTLDPSPLGHPAEPDDALFELSVKSRYGWLKRALVFCAGMADVVYSSQHIVKMSQYTHVPFGVIARRLSLVVLLVIGIVAEVAFGLREALEPLIAAHVVNHLPFIESVSPGTKKQLPALLALIFWTGGVATLYLTLLLWMRRYSSQNLSKLKRLKHDKSERLAAIRDKHLTQLETWGTDYGGTLDAAVELTARHIRMLGEHYMQAMRQRFADRPLLEEAERMSASLFAHLPESEGKLQDRVTTAKHSWRHALWPRRTEMDFVIRQAQYREAWQHIELTINELRRGSPDVREVSEFWRDLAVYTTTYDEVFDDGSLERLQEAYATLASRCLQAAGEGHQAFATSTEEMLVNLDEQLQAAAPLLAARIELANQRIAADAARFQAEIIRARERARLEVMAFEI